MLYFIRHGQSRANVDRVFAGSRYYAPLTVQGKAQAGQVGQRLFDEHIHIDRIIASPIERALQTAQIIAQSIGIDPDEVRIDPRLAEYDMGELSGKPLAGVSAVEIVSAPGAEDPLAFRRRVHTALDDAKSLPGNTLLVSHAGVGRMIEAIQQGLEPARFYEIEAYPNIQIVPL